MGHEAAGRPRTPDLAVADIVHIWLHRGRDNARPIGEMAETLKLSRRQVEAGVQELRLRGFAVCSGPEGVWLATSANEVEALYRQLRRRIVTQSATAWKVRQTWKRMAAAEARQMDLGLVA